MESNGQHISTNGFSSMDTCGYELVPEMGVDTRNAKWQSRQNGAFGAAANKAHNFKDYAKYMKRREEKIERENQKIHEKLVMQ